MALELPSEIWEAIFDLATEDERIYNTQLPNAMDRSEWFPRFEGGWIPRGPQEVVNSLQRKGYATKKAIVLTCRKFYTIAYDSLFRYIFLPTPRRLASVVNILNTEPELALRTRRLQLFSAPPDTASALLLRGILRQCKHLEVLVIDGVMSQKVFGELAGDLRKSLKAIEFSLATDCLPKLIAMLSGRPRLECISLTFFHPVKKRTSIGTATSEFDVPLGAVSNITLALSSLLQLTVRGPCSAFVEQAAGWTLPRLQTFTIDSGAEQSDLPDLVEFLTSHGEALEYLDVDGLEPVPIKDILALCPMLTTLIFNPDWRLVPANEDINHAAAVLTQGPHDAITHIGLHGLHDALGVSRQLSVDGQELKLLPTASQMHISLLRRTNESVFRALTKANFPNLKCVRAVSRPLLAALERANGPGKEPGCFDRWERWWTQCANAGMRLEDCTGDYLGTLPEPEVEEEEEDEGGSEEWSGSEEDEEGRETIRDELRELLVECQKMTATRESTSPFVAMFQAMGGMPGMPGMPGVPGMPGMGMGGMPGMGMPGMGSAGMPGMGMPGMGMGMAGMPGMSTPGMPGMPGLGFYPGTISPGMTPFGPPNMQGFPGMGPGVPGYPSFPPPPNR